MAQRPLEEFIKSSIGRKYIMGLTGAVWAGFVFGHMAGNLLMFVSADAYNAYGHAIVSGGLIYLIEAVLIAALLLHVGCALSLIIDNRRARPQEYAIPAAGAKAATLASRTMAMTGSIILIFVILHLITFKFGPHYRTVVEGVEMRDLYRLMMEVFVQPLYVFWYVICLVLLGFHLRHGVGSIFQSLGLLNNRSQKTIQAVSWIYASVVAVGFLAQPISVFLKWKG